MERVKFKLPQTHLYTTSIKLMVMHMNYGNHLGNDSVLSLAQELRVNWLNSLGHSELDVDGIGLIQTDAMVIYKSEAHLADEIRMDLYLGDFNSKAMDLYCQLTRISDNQEVARVKTGLLFFDYQTRKIASMSESFSTYLGSRNV
ncbi:thioesterase family protein [Halobacteriovorax sp. HLS]|uniref:thioesterase family protein n=1 Tax=Halobacteriovorax sp. HLS TaxID=2234000 RepID=UPI000FDC2201|nr:thioesterase family protein [Halobacteriovorax sp. HLS]